MARARTGSLELRGGVWHAKVSVERDGRVVRDRYSLDTSDRATAERRKDKLLRDLAAGRAPPRRRAPARARPDTSWPRTSRLESATA